MSYFDDNEDRIISGGSRYGRRKKEEPGHVVGDVECIRVTPSGKALYVRLEDNDELCVPFSQIHPDSEISEENCEPETEGELVITRWLAEKKELLDGDGDGF